MLGLNVGPVVLRLRDDSLVDQQNYKGAVGGGVLLVGVVWIVEHARHNVLSLSFASIRSGRSRCR